MVTLLSRLLSIGIAATLMLVAAPLHGQEADLTYQIIRGTLKDSRSNQNLIFANVTVPGTHIGTVTNSDGDFTIKLRKTLSAEFIEFSHLGYINKKVPISTLKPEGSTIKLDPASIPLDEVTVRPEDPRQLVIKALAKVPYNYSVEPAMLTGFYRESIRQRREYISLSEAVLDIYKASYRKNSENDRVRVYKGRKSENVKRADTLMVKLQGGPNVSLLLDVAKNPELLMFEGNLDYYNFTLEDMVNIDNKLNYVISFKQKPHIITPHYYGKIYIDTKNLAFTMLQFSLNLENKDEASSMFVRRKPVGVRITPTSTSYLVTYREIDGTYFFNYARHELNFKCNWRRRLFNSNYTVVAELAITDRDFNNVTRIPIREVFHQSDILVNTVEAFNDNDFWGEHNYIDPDESIESAIRKYGRRLLRNKK